MKKMLFTLIAAAAICLISQEASAQKPDSLIRDTTIIIPPLMDSTLVGRDILDMLSERSANGATVKINQSENIKDALEIHISKSPNKKMQGYRIRIYFDNNQNARNISADVAAKFSQLYPFVPVYRTYDKIYFKVTAGDFRTKSEAVKLLKDMEKNFLSAFIIKENINFPPL